MGNSAVGKSSLLKRYSDDTFDTHYMTTIGVDFVPFRTAHFQRFKKIQIDDKVIKL